VQSIVSLLLFLGLSLWEDYHTKKISNLLIVTALVSAVFYQVRQTGSYSILLFLFQAGLTISILFPLYVFHVLGAGDIKLLGVTAVFLSWRLALWAFVWGLYFSLVPIAVLFFRKEKIPGSRIPMSGPIAGGVLLVLYKEGCI